jgi:hypothetical protein
MKNRILGYGSAAGYWPARPEEPERSRASDAVEAWRTIEEFVAAHPAFSLGAAIALGVCAGWFIKRR